MKNIHKTLIFTSILSLLSILSALFIQLKGKSPVLSACSYLDPITIDLFAFLIALFLVIEGFARIFEHPNASLKRQSTRMIRIAIGFAIITIHVLQFFAK